MFFIDDPYQVVLERQLEHSDSFLAHKLSGNSPASHAWKLLVDPSHILLRLNDGYLIFSAFGLNRDDVMTPVLVETDIELVDLNLPYSLHRGAEMILQAV